ncbi:permease [Faecalimonas sp.]
MNFVYIIKIIICLYALLFTIILITDCLKHKSDFSKHNLFTLAFIGFFSDLLDTWGIGSFATCQAAFKFTHSCSDEKMPGTLNVAHTLPTIAEFLLFLHLIKIEGITLIFLISGAIIGAIYGASIVSKWSPKIIRLALGFALIILAIILSLKLAHIGPFEKTLTPESIVHELTRNGFTIQNSDEWIYHIKNNYTLSDTEKTIYSDPSITKNELNSVMSKLKHEQLFSFNDRNLTSTISEHLTYGLNGYKLIIGIFFNTLLGALMTVGVGLYAPCMAMVSALGLNVTAAFPIMMGSCAFLMPSASIQFIHSGKYDRKAALTISIFGLFGVFVAYTIAASLPMNILTIIVICVMLYTSLLFFKDAKRL